MAYLCASAGRIPLHREDVFAGSGIELDLCPSCSLCSDGMINIRQKQREGLVGRQARGTPYDIADA